MRNGLVESTEDYVYSRAGSYLGKEGFIEIEKLEIENSMALSIVEYELQIRKI